MIVEMVEDELGFSLPPAAHDKFRIMLGILDKLNVWICQLDKENARRASRDAASQLVRFAISNPPRRSSDWL